jgi:hypothetical protein
MQKLLTQMVAVTTLVVLLAAQGPAAGQAQPAASNAQPGVHRMELYNGSVRSVTYFGSGLSQGDQNTVNDLQQAENAVAREQLVGDQVSRLRREYVRDEITTERFRQAAQDMMYSYAAGFNPIYSAYIPVTLYTDYLTPSRYYNYGVPYAAGFPYPAGLAGAPLVTAAYQRPGLGIDLAATHEGPIKVAMATTFASPESLNQAVRAYDAAIARVDASGSLKNQTSLRSPAGTPTIVPAAYTASGVGKRVQLVLRNNNEKVEGTLVSKEGDWYVIDTANGRERIRDSEVMRVVEPKSTVQPASGPGKE